MLIELKIPKSIKGRGCLEALKHFPHSDRVWAETKYDGERAQIHVQVREGGISHITIFSKSKRDSTLDRWGVHEYVYTAYIHYNTSHQYVQTRIVRNALGLSTKPSMDPASSKIKNIILDAELVAFNDRCNKIDGHYILIATLIDINLRFLRVLEDSQPHYSHRTRGSKQNVCASSFRKTEHN